jgi:hypothetical protein
MPFSYTVDIDQILRTKVRPHDGHFLLPQIIETLRHNSHTLKELLQEFTF